MRRGNYILVDGKPVLEPDLLRWARWYESAERAVAKTVFVAKTVLPGYITVPDDITVSTVFLGLDHQFGNGPPLLWETMIFNGPRDGWCQRYSSLVEAVAGHDEAVRIALTKEDA